MVKIGMAHDSGKYFHFPISDIAAICGVDLSTARRWLRGASCPPPAALTLLQLMRKRDIGCFHAAWRGWTINPRGELCSPENWIATPGDVLSIQFLQAQLASWRLEAMKLREELAGPQMENQPAPDQWEFKVG